MAVKTFAAIDVGSFEITMKIYEISKKRTLKQIDYIRREIDLGTESFRTGFLSFEKVNELCAILKENRKIMDSYRVHAYKAYGTSALREIKNTEILLEQIKLRTGIEIEVITNSEQRFLDYKSVAIESDKFQKFISEPTIILDVGGGGIQMSLFEKSKLIATQNMKLGVLRILDRMHTVGASLNQYEHLVGELCESQINTYKKLYLKDLEIKNLIIIDDYVSYRINRRMDDRDDKTMEDTDRFLSNLNNLRGLSKGEFATYMAIPDETVPMITISFILLIKVLEVTGAQHIWAPGTTLCDGIAYEFAEDNGYIDSAHDFENDIRACALQIAKRYSGSRKRAETLEGIALSIFDAIKDKNGLSDRDRLLLQISTYLHDCGKYISMANLAECSYSIIKNTEIIGISHRERIIIANVVKYNQVEFDYYEEFNDHEHVEAEDHKRIAKLTAILRLANGLDRSHKMKFRGIKVAIEQDKLLLKVETDMDISLEKGLFGQRATFFEGVYNLRPVIRQLRSF